MNGFWVYNFLLTCWKIIWEQLNSLKTSVTVYSLLVKLWLALFKEWERRRKSSNDSNFLNTLESRVCVWLRDLVNCASWKLSILFTKNKSAKWRMSLQSFFFIAASEVQLLSITEQKLKINDSHCLLNEIFFYYKIFSYGYNECTNEFVR